MFYEVTMFHRMKSLKETSIVKFYGNKKSNAKSESILLCCIRLALLKFFLWLGKVFLFLPWSSRHFQWQSHEPACKKSPSIFFKKKNRQVLKTCQSQFQNNLNSEWDFKKEKIFLKIKRARNGTYWSKYENFCPKNQWNEIKD